MAVGWHVSINPHAPPPPKCIPTHVALAGFARPLWKGNDEGAVEYAACRRWWDIWTRGQRRSSPRASRSCRERSWSAASARCLSTSRCCDSSSAARAPEAVQARRRTGRSSRVGSKFSSTASASAARAPEAVQARRRTGRSSRVGSKFSSTASASGDVRSSSDGLILCRGGISASVCDTVRGLHVGLQTLARNGGVVHEYCRTALEWDVDGARGHPDRRWIVGGGTM
jgi:hypothetical protein